jgi:tRNA1Val (adenine37-N6)-methyltransferase
VGNSYFQFKQFTVQQSQTAMKVCTDACLFGAWLAQQIQMLALPHKTLLDVGTGTGLLGLQIAQACSMASITAIEIDPAAATQANDNFEHSPFTARLTAIQADITVWQPTALFDGVFSNPPFYENDLTSTSTTKNVAHHSTALTLQQLFGTIASYSQQPNWLALLLPYKRHAEAIELAEALNWHLVANMLVQQTPQHNYFRTMLLWRSNSAVPANLTTLAIQDKGKYTPAFSALLQPYYLNL